MKRISKKIVADNNTGFGNQASAQGGRLINSDGTFNVRRTGISFLDGINFFHELIRMRWAHFNLIVISFYAVINLLFASIYYFIGIEHLNGMIANNTYEGFLEAFFFSTQTFATVGYGRINPTGIATNVVASLEALLGVMSFALVTGLLYGRFSRPMAKILTSNNMIIAPYQGITGLMFRIANAQKNQLIEAEVQFMMSINEKDNDKTVRKFYPLKLERDKIASMALSWTIVHPIDENSPIYSFTQDDLAEGDAEFIFMLKAFDDTYSQTVHTRSSYKHNDLVWGAKFNPMFQRSENGDATLLELDKINHFIPAELPLRLQKAASDM